MRFQTLLIIFIFLGCQSSKHELPILSYKINSEGNKDYYTISYLGFTDQNGMQVSTETIENKVLIANFFFTSCPSICPPMRHELIKISNEFINEKDVLLLSHSIDPKNDTIEVLKNYSEATEVPSSKWLFVKSSEANTKKQAQQFMTNFKPNKNETDFYHSSYVALVDKNQMIRGFYNSLVSEDIVRLKTDIRMLLE